MTKVKFQMHSNAMTIKQFKGLRTQKLIFDLVCVITHRNLSLI